MKRPNIMTLPGINIQWPISLEILNGSKTVETRTYCIPAKYIGQELLIIETPGKAGNFKARIVGTIIFSNSFKYASKTEFYKDPRHKVLPESPWAWKTDKKKWGWEIAKVTKFEEPILAPKRRGIVFTSQIKIKGK